MRHASIVRSPDGQGGSLGSGSGSMGGASPSIRPITQGIGAGPKPVGPLGSAPKEIPPEPPPPKIQAFEQKMGVRKHEDSWARSPNVTGNGAIHVKSFHCKLGDDSLAYMDQQINEWLDAHPQYEVKFVTTAVGEWTGKMKEPQMVCSVWV